MLAQLGLCLLLRQLVMHLLLRPYGFRLPLRLQMAYWQLQMARWPFSQYYRLHRP
jgi:hypothetical protein